MRKTLNICLPVHVGGEADTAFNVHAIDPDAKIDDVASLTHRACMQGRAMCSSCSSIVAKIGILPNLVSSVHFV